MTHCSVAQKNATYTSSEILLQIQKLKVFGSVLYIAAHPDDENTRLLAYLANEKKLRTAYLSLTRGDGGQNLIGDEQGIELGLIRTQELLAARRQDGAEQFFSRAYDFGFSKSPEEALRIWNHDKILYDVVWIIRKFQPDVIITRFPTTGEGGHGHHTASAILAGEAFDAAADSLKFSEQFALGVKPWQAKRLLWNTFNFGGNNTQRDDQFKIDCGVYNALIGKSYGEIAAQSRSQHKSQGFGVPAQRGEIFEYFSTIKGTPPVNDLMDAVNTNANRLVDQNFEQRVNSIIEQFDIQQPKKSVPALVQLYSLAELFPNSVWKEKKLEDIQAIIEAASGLFFEATANKEVFSPGDSMKISFTVNDRSGILVDAFRVKFNDAFSWAELPVANKNLSNQFSFLLPQKTPFTQPYWLETTMQTGSFSVEKPENIGLAQNAPLQAVFTFAFSGKTFSFKKPVQYKFTDPVKGEMYQPVFIVPNITIQTSPSVLLFRNNKPESKDIVYKIRSNNPATTNAILHTHIGKTVQQQEIRLSPESDAVHPIHAKDWGNNSTQAFYGGIKQPLVENEQQFSVHRIQYDHIPDIYFNRVDEGKIIKIDLNTIGKNAGYIAGAGDKIPEALEQMGYAVTTLRQEDMNMVLLKKFDVIVTGIRAYNIHEWLAGQYDLLMQYVREGGVLVNQFNTNNLISSVNGKMSPYPFGISRTRVSEEDTPVRFLEPNDDILHYPNEITQQDFSGWVQERSVYQAEKADTAYRKILGMHDKNEPESNGSLLVANVGKGKYVYTGLSLFRQLPAGTPGAYRLFANILAKPKQR